MGAQQLDAAEWSAEGGASPLDDDVAAVLGVDPRAFQRTPAPPPRPAPAPRHLARGVWIPVALAATAGASALLVLLPARPPVGPRARPAPATARPMAQMLVDAPPPRPAAPAAPAAVSPPVVAPHAAPDVAAVGPSHALSRPSAGARLASREIRTLEHRHTPGPGDRAWSPHDHFASDADAAYSPGRAFPAAPALRTGEGRDAEVADLGRTLSPRRSLVITPDGGRARVGGLHGPTADRLDRLQSPEVVRSVRIDAVDAIRLLRQK